MVTIIYDELKDDFLHISGSFEFDDDKIAANTFDGDLFKVEDGGYYLKGTANAVCRIVCDRCGQEADIEFPVDISINIETSATTAMDKAECEMSDEDGDSFYSGPVSLDVNELIRQEILLQIPVKRLCRPDCIGVPEYSDDEKFDEVHTKSLTTLKNVLKEK